MKKLVLIFLALSLYSLIKAQTIYTFAGNGIGGFSGDGGPASSAQVLTPYGVATDAAGNVYISQGYRVRKISSSGVISTIAGTGTAGYTGDGGPATMAQLNGTSALTVDASGNIYLCDGNYIRKINSAGIINTIAGNGAGGFSGDGGPATSAQLKGPSAVAVDLSGNIYIADYLNNRIRKVNTSGIITTVVGDGNGGYYGDGGPATSAEIYWPSGVVIDNSGNLYIVETANNTIRKVNAAGIISTIAGTVTSGFSGDNGPATAARMWEPFAIALDGAGNLYFSDTGNQRIRKISASGIITTVAGNGSQGFSGDGGPPTSARLYGPWGVAVDASNNIYIADQNNFRIRAVCPSNCVAGVQEMERTSFFSIYPNPVSNTLRIETSNFSNAQIEIINTLGQMVYSSAINENTVSVNVEQYRDGIYSIKLIDGDKIYSGKFVKQ